MTRLALPSLVMLAWCSTAPAAVDFDAEVAPIFRARCLNCHARGKYKAGLSLETRDSALKGGESGPAIVPGESAESLLVQLVSGGDPDRRMPPQGDPLTPEQVGLIRTWVDQGAAWPEGSGLGFRKAPLAPRTPPVPEVAGLDHPVDRLLARHFSGHPATEAADRAFARRASLDLVGLIPSAEKVAAFEADSRPDRHLRYAEALLADRDAYADHWLTFWNDALRNAYRGAGFIDGGRATITRWLYRSLAENTPYDRFVRELVSPSPGSGAEGFTKGIVWRGVVNASQIPPVQAAQNVTQVFLGTNLKCASCHDSFVNHWKLSEAYALAAAFADGPLEINRCDQPTGKMAKAGFLYPELGSIDPAASKAERLKQLADLLVKPEDGRFARTIVNRLWAQLMGRGIVEPVDDMDQPAWDQDLLDWLAADFVAHGHDLKHTLGVIASSRAYRLRSVGLDEPASRSAYAFRGPLAKRMTAEQFADAVSTLTGAWPEVVNDMIRVDGRGQGGQVAAARAAVSKANAERRSPAARPEARWVWSHANASHDPGGRFLFRKVIKLDRLPKSALAVATCDNEVVLHVNGRKVGQGDRWSEPVAVDVAGLLKIGDNVIAAEATNWPDPKHGKRLDVSGANPAAFLAWVGGFEEDGRPAWGVGTDATWLWSADAEGDGWKSGPTPEGWKHAVELPGADRIYGGHVKLAEVVARASVKAEVSPVRASLAFDDPLMLALGRTSREQVVTRRDPIATTLQALELTNGGTLDARLRRGARKHLERIGRDPEKIAGAVFFEALGRSPTPGELAAARELIGPGATEEGVHDLLWAVAMLPEFQLIE